MLNHSQNDGDKIMEEYAANINFYVVISSQNKLIQFSF